MAEGEGIRGNDQADARLVRECRKGALELRRLAYVRSDDVDVECGCRRLNRSQIPNPIGVVGMLDNRDPGHRGLKVFEQLQPFPAEGIFEAGETRHVTAWMCQALDEAGSHG